MREQLQSRKQTAVWSPSLSPPPLATRCSPLAGCLLAANCLSQHVDSLPLGTIRQIFHHLRLKTNVTSVRVSTSWSASSALTQKGTDAFILEGRIHVTMSCVWIWNSWRSLESSFLFVGRGWNMWTSETLLTSPSCWSRLTFVISDDLSWSLILDIPPAAANISSKLVQICQRHVYRGYKWREWRWWSPPSRWPPFKTVFQHKERCWGDSRHRDLSATESNQSIKLETHRRNVKFEQMCGLQKRTAPTFIGSQRLTVPLYIRTFSSSHFPDRLVTFVWCISLSFTSCSRKLSLSFRSWFFSCFFLSASLHSLIISSSFLLLSYLPLYFIIKYI